MSTVSLAIVNDYPVVVAGLAQMLEPYADRVRVVDLAVDQPPSRPVDVILYDAFAGPQPPDAVLEQLLSQHAPGRVVLYTWALEPDLVTEALRAGFAAYTDKATTAEELIGAIERVAGGERDVVVRGLARDPDEAETEDDVEGPPGQWPGMEHDLSPRESEVVALITLGLTNQDISERAYLSINTVKTYIRSAYQKMGVTNRSQAVRWGMEHGLEHAARRGTEHDAQQGAEHGTEQGAEQSTEHRTTRQGMSRRVALPVDPTAERTSSAAPARSTGPTDG